MIGAIVLAAGYSSRMDSFKPLLDFAGESALARAIRSVAVADEVAVVTGYRRQDLERIIAGEGATELYNVGYDSGMFGSVVTGVRYFADKGARGVLLLPCDCPAVPQQAVKTLLENADDELAVPCYKGKKGHPLWIPAKYFDEILTHDGTMGLKGVTLRHEDTLRRLDMPYEGTVLDMDFPDDYRRILSFADIPPLEKLSAGRRFILLRHGETLPHQGKIFVGWYDVELSEAGKEQARQKAAELAAAGLKPRSVYCGELQRARYTANTVADALGVSVKAYKELNEICLGAWDGRLIEDIKKEFPAEYERRGKNLMTYKFDDRSESFFDLQHRVIGCLKQILLDDDSRDIVIVSHAGVMKCLYGNLTGHDIEWAFDRCWPKKGEHLEITV